MTRSDESRQRRIANKATTNLNRPLKGLCPIYDIIFDIYLKIVIWTGLDCDGGVAAGLHDARVLLAGGVHHHPEEECQAQQISGEN